MLIIVERTIRQCAELTVMTVMILNVFNCLMCEVVSQAKKVSGYVKCVLGYQFGRYDFPIEFWNSSVRVVFF
jgi:hypothetical protein